MMKCYDAHTFILLNSSVRGGRPRSGFNRVNAKMFMSWIFYAFLSAGFAALVAIFGKVGIQNLDSTLATTVRSVIMAVFLLIVSLGLGKFKGFEVSAFTGKEWLFIVLAGIAGALSWLFYFFALKHGPGRGGECDRSHQHYICRCARGDIFGRGVRLETCFRRDFCSAWGIFDYDEIKSDHVIDR